MPEQAIDKAHAATLGLLARAERRLDGATEIGRDIDKLFKQLAWILTEPANDTAEAAVEIALRALATSEQWARLADGPPRVLRQVADLALSRLVAYLPDASASDAKAFAERAAATWAACTTPSRDVLIRVLLEHLDDATTKALAAALRDRAVRLRQHGAAALVSAPGQSTPAGVEAREHMLAVSRATSCLGHVDDAVRILEAEPPGDPRVLITWADVLVEHERFDAAVDRLKRAIIVLDDPRPVRERLIDALLATGDRDGAVEQALLLIEETGELLYWDVLTELLADEPERVDALRDGLAESAPATQIEILMNEGDHDAVAAASSAKTFSYEQLWRLGDFLVGHDSSKSAKLYERAIKLQGSVAQSRAQCQDLGQRLEAVMPFFESIGRKTKPRRLARELLSRQKSNVPMQREFERIFGKALR